MPNKDRKVVYGLYPSAISSICWDGVAIDTLPDMEELLNGIPIDEVVVSMTSSGPAAVILAMYIAVAKKRNIPLEKLEGTIQTDILKEFIVQKERLFPVEPSARLVIDMIEFAASNMPKWNAISVSGCHMCEAGAAAKQELAFTLTRRRAREERLARLSAFKNERLISGKIFETDVALDEVMRMARTSRNMMPFLIKAAEKEATLGEIVQALKDVWGAESF